MNDKPQYQRVEGKVRKLAATWQERLGLDHWEIEHVFFDAYEADDRQDDYKTTAITEARWQYLQAKIKWYFPSMLRHSDEVIEKILVHELCHVLLAPEQSLLEPKVASQADRYSELLELSTEMTTRALCLAWGVGS